MTAENTSNRQASFLKPKVELIIRIIVALIILQTLRFKFTAADESVALFNEVSRFLTGDNSLQALLRIGTGVIELIAGIFLLYKPTALWGALLTAGTMAGAVVTHLFIIGINFQNDGGALFAVALVALIGSLHIIFNRRKAIPVIGKKFR